MERHARADNTCVHGQAFSWEGRSPGRSAQVALPSSMGTRWVRALGTGGALMGALRAGRHFCSRRRWWRWLCPRCWARVARARARSLRPALAS
eukprot:320810-Alexandrium_andersonii.AAC.2